MASSSRSVVTTLLARSKSIAIAICCLVPPGSSRSGPTSISSDPSILNFTEIDAPYRTQRSGFSPFGDRSLFRVASLLRVTKYLARQIKSHKDHVDKQRSCRQATYTLDLFAVHGQPALAGICQRFLAAGAADRHRAAHRWRPGSR